MTEDRVKLLINEALHNALEQHENKMLEHLDTKFEHVVTTFASAFPGGAATDAGTIVQTEQFLKTRMPVNF